MLSENQNKSRLEIENVKLIYLESLSEIKSLVNVSNT